MLQDGRNLMEIIPDFLGYFRDFGFLGDKLIMNKT